MRNAALERINMAIPSRKKALDALNKLNNYSKLPVDHRWVSTVRHYIKEAGRTVRANRPAQQRKVPIFSEEEFVESLKKRIPPNKWDLGPSRYIASIVYRHFILMLKTKTVA